MALTVRHTFSGGTTQPLTAIPRPGRRAVSLALGIAFAILLIDALINPRAFFDLWAIETIQRIDAPGVYTGINLIERVTNSSGAVLMWAVVTLTFAGLRWWSSAFAAALLPAGGVLNAAIGMVTERTRPHLEELTRASGNWEERSFPSGHVMGAVMLYGLVYAAAGRIGSAVIRRTVRGGSLVVIGTVGFSRVWDGAHWPTDVLGAYALGGLLLAPLLTLQSRLAPAIDGLPLIRAQALPHDAGAPHAHALTSLVHFDGDRVAKVYAPGLLPRVIYWIAFQAPFPYVANQAALRAALHRRNLAGMLTEYWYGERRVARILGIERLDGRAAVVSERIEGGGDPSDPAVAKAFLAGLTTRFEAAGLPTWQIDPVQPRANDNVIETAPGVYQIIDLESGLVSPVASRTTWRRALRRGMVPFYDEVFFDVTRGYVAREEEDLRARMGEEWLTELQATLDALEAETLEWHRSEPRLLRRAFAGVVTGGFVRTWKGRIDSSFANGQIKARAWMDRAVATWEDEERIDELEAAGMRAQMTEPAFQRMLPYLGGHILLSIPLRFPFGSIIRPLLVAGALGAAAVRYARGRIDRDELRLAWQIHSPVVMVLAGIPGVGTFAYLASKPVRANRLLLRVLADAAFAKAPWRLYERTGIRPYVVRPNEVERAVQAAADDGPAWELAWAARPQPRRPGGIRALALPRRSIEAPEPEVEAARAA